jgi:cbb3-type cytochrome oxidase maturation protein
MAVVIALFVAGIAMGLAGACMWAWGVHTGQLRDLERTKEQLFWPDIGDNPRPEAAAWGPPHPDNP